MRREVLDHMLVFGQRHLEHVLVEFVSHYDVAGPTRALAGERPIARSTRSHSPAVPRQTSNAAIALGGLIHEYRRAA